MVAISLYNVTVADYKASVKSIPLNIHELDLYEN